MLLSFPPIEGNGIIFPPSANSVGPSFKDAIVNPPNIGDVAFIIYNMIDFRVLADGTNVIINRGTSYGL
jgi:hypothetical protein